MLFSFSSSALINFCLRPCCWIDSLSCSFRSCEDTRIPQSTCTMLQSWRVHRIQYISEIWPVMDDWMTKALLQDRPSLFLKVLGALLQESCLPLLTPSRQRSNVFQLEWNGARLWHGPLLVIGVGLLREPLKGLPKHHSRQRPYAHRCDGLAVWPFALWTWQPQLAQAAALCRSSAPTWNSLGWERLRRWMTVMPKHSHFTTLHTEDRRPAIMHCSHQHHSASRMEASDILSRTSGAKHPKSISEYLTISQESRGWWGAKQRLMRSQTIYSGFLVSKVVQHFVLRNQNLTFSKSPKQNRWKKGLKCIIAADLPHHATGSWDRTHCGQSAPGLTVDFIQHWGKSAIPVALAEEKPIDIPPGA